MENGKMAFGAVALLLMLSFGCVSEGSGWAGSGVWLPGWSGLVIVAMSIVFLLLALGYVISSFIMDEKMKAWVRKEVGQVFYSMLIVLIVLGMIVALDTSILPAVIIGTGTPDWQNYISSTVCCQPGTPGCTALVPRSCHIAVAGDYLQMMYESQRTSMISYFFNHYFTSFFSAFNVGIGTRALIHLGGFSIRPLAGMSMGTDFFSILFDLTMKNMMLTRVQQIFIDYMVVGFFPAMISVGLVMRIFYFTRKLGGTLIALALCMYYVYPLFYVLADSIFFQFTGGWVTAPKNIGLTADAANRVPLPFLNGQLNTGDATYNVMLQGKYKLADYCKDENGNYAFAGTPEEDSWLGSFNTFRDNWDSVRNGGEVKWLYNFFGGTGGPSQGFAPDGPMGNVAAIMIYTLIIPFLALMTTLATFKVISPLMGGDVELALISRLI